MNRLRRVLDNPPEVLFFLFLSAFALVIGVIYWFASYEPAGTILLGGFGIATGLAAVKLGTDDEGTGAVDRPFLDEAGRLPGDSLAPFAVGLGAAAIATGSIFGPAPVLVGLLPLAWGAWAWQRGAGEELDATEAASVASDAAAARAPADR